MTSGEKPELSHRLFLLGAALAAMAASILLYGPAFHGPFIGDDAGYIVNNVYIQTLDLAHLKAVLDPGGAPALFTANYAPVHMLACMLEWHLFGPDPFGYHVVNALAHGLVTALLVAFFLESGIPRTAAALLGAVFLLHPANVEAVAWSFQLKTILALGFAVGALLVFRRSPVLATLLLAMGLLAKISAVFALPVLATQMWVASGEEGAALRRRWPWLGVWLALFVACGWPEFTAFLRYGNRAHVAYPDVWTHLRSIVAVGGRYLVMAATSLGVSAFAQPAPSSPLDPWWLGGAVLLALLAWRSVVTLLRRSEEAVYWVWAAASFAPVSQIFPFLYPVGDRYLYMILPGLLGGAFFLGRDVVRRSPALQRPGLRTPAVVGALAVCVLFGWHATLRVDLWRSDALLGLDSAEHYPNGQIALYLGARHAAQDGDAAAALTALHRLAASGFDQFQALSGDPVFASLRSSPEFAKVIHQVAGNWIQDVSGRRRLLQPELLTLALAHEARGEREEAIAACQKALQQGGPLDAAVRAQLAALQQQSAD